MAIEWKRVNVADFLERERVILSLNWLLLAWLRGIEIDADGCIESTKVDGVYSADPMRIRCREIDTLGYDEVLENN